MSGKYRLTAEGLEGIAPTSPNEALGRLRGLLCEPPTPTTLLDIKITLSALEGGDRATGEAYVRAHLREHAERAHNTLNAIRELYPDLAPGSALIFTVSNDLPDAVLQDLAEEVRGWTRETVPGRAAFIVPEGVTVRGVPMPEPTIPPLPEVQVVREIERAGFVPVPGPEPEPQDLIHLEAQPGTGASVCGIRAAVTVPSLTLTTCPRCRARIQRAAEGLALQSPGDGF